jgi:hypothetical protein
MLGGAEKANVKRETDESAQQKCVRSWRRLGRNGRFRAAAETLAVQLGQGQLDGRPEQVGTRGARIPQWHSRGGSVTLSKDDRRALEFENRDKIDVMRGCKSANIT